MSCGIRINLSLKGGAGSSSYQPCDKFSRPRNISEVTVEYTSYYLDNVIVAPEDKVFPNLPYTYILLILLYVQYYIHHINILLR